MSYKSSGRGRGFNAAKKGSGQVGFQSAPPTHPDVPSAADEIIIEQGAENDSDVVEVEYLDEMYDTFKTTVLEEGQSLDDSVGLSLEEQVAVLEARERLARSKVSLSPDSSRTAAAMAYGWGLSETQYKEALDNAANKFEADSNYYDYLEPSEAVDSVKGLIEEAPFTGQFSEHLGDGLIQDIMQGKVLLSRSDLVQLQQFKDEAYAVYARDTSPDVTQPLDAEWISSSVQRRCELCGQFITTRDSHGSFEIATSRRYGEYRHMEQGKELPSTFCKGNYEITSEVEGNLFKAARTYAPLRTFADKVKWGDRDRKYNLDTLTPLETDEILVRFEGDTYREDYLSIPEVDKNDLPAYSPELLEDVYMTGDGSVREYIIALYADKKGLGGKKTTFNVPQNIREAIVEAPPFTSVLSSRSPESETLEPMNRVMLILASRVEPAFSEGEIKRMIMKGDAGVVHALLSARRTRDVAAEIISNYPSEGAKKLILMEGRIPQEILSYMSSSGSSEIRAFAASSPSLRDEDAVRLAEDPDPEVRKALIVPLTDSNMEVMQTAVDGDSYDLVVNSGAWVRGMYGGDSYLRRNVDKVGEMLINDPDPKVAELAFSSLRFEVVYDTPAGHIGYSRRVSGNRSGLSNKQKFIVSKVKTRTRFNELKKFILMHNEVYVESDPDVAKLLAY